MPAIKGSCLCGNVAFEIRGPLSGALNCHCTMCRKAHGAAFRSRAQAASGDFVWVRGADSVTYYESSPGTHRGFCRVCGSALLSRFDADITVIGLPLGCLDTDPGVTPACHVHTADKATWFDITDGLPRFAQGIAADADVDRGTRDCKAS